MPAAAPKSRSLLSLLLLFLTVAWAGAGDWPKGYIVHERSTSPNGQFGVLIPAVGGYTEDVAPPNFLADLKAKTTLARISGSKYFENANRRGLAVVWSADSTWCTVLYDGRFGFNHITVLEITPKGVKQTPLEDSVHQMLDEILSVQSTDAKLRGEGFAYARALPARRLRVRAMAETDPKREGKVPNFLAYFHGTYDLNLRRWVYSDARVISEGMADNLTTAYVPVNEAGQKFETQAQRLKWLDDQMNIIYGVVRFIYSPKYFAEVRSDQIEWLRKRERTKTSKAKADLTKVRIQELQALVF